MLLSSRLIYRIGSEPITLAEAYQHLRLDPIDSSDLTGRPDDDLVLSYISAAREYCENFTGATFSLSEYEVSFTSWSMPIELPNAPFGALTRVTVSDDASDPDVDITNFVVTYNGKYPVVNTASGVTLPAIAPGDTARITYIAGYGSESDAPAPVPATARQAMLLLIGHWYSMREAVAEGAVVRVPLGVESLLRPHRMRMGFA